MKTPGLLARHFEVEGNPFNLLVQKFSLFNQYSWLTLKSQLGHFLKFPALAIFSMRQYTKDEENNVEYSSASARSKY